MNEMDVDPNVDYRYRVKRILALPERKIKQSLNILLVRERGHSQTGTCGCHIQRETD